MKKLIIVGLGLLLSLPVYAATNIYCAPTLRCSGYTCGVMPKTFVMAEFYPHLRHNPLKPIPGLYHFTGAQSPALCTYQLGNLPLRHPYVNIRSPILIPDATGKGWSGTFCTTYNPDDCPFKFPG